MRMKTGAAEESPAELSEGYECPRGAQSLPDWLVCAVPSVGKCGRPQSVAAVKCHKREGSVQ